MTEGVSFKKPIEKVCVLVETSPGDIGLLRPGDFERFKEDYGKDNDFKYSFVYGIEDSAVTLRDKVKFELDFEEFKYTLFGDSPKDDSRKPTLVSVVDAIMYSGYETSKIETHTHDVPSIISKNKTRSLEEILMEQILKSKPTIPEIKYLYSKPNLFDQKNQIIIGDEGKSEKLSEYDKPIKTSEQGNHDEYIINPPNSINDLGYGKKPNSYDNIIDLGHIKNEIDYKKYFDKDEGEKK